MGISLNLLFGVCLIIAVSVFDARGQAGCEAPWHYFLEIHGGRRACWWYSKDKANWINASAWCKTLGGRLIEMTSALRNSFVTREMPRQFQGNYWIGLSDIEQDGIYKWMDTKRPLELDPSITFNKAFDQTKNCVTINENGHWTEEACSVTHWFVCEK